MTGMRKISGPAGIEKINERVVAATKRKLRKRTNDVVGISSSDLPRKTPADSGVSIRRHAAICVFETSRTYPSSVFAQTVIWQPVLKRFGNSYNATPEWKSKRYAAAKYAVRSKQLRGDIHRGERGIN